MYLKDGSELCRMIGLVTKGRVPEGVFFWTNNISTLEEKNLALFIKIVAEEFGESDKDLKDIFKKPDEKKKRKKSTTECPKGGHEIFNKFADFSFVLTGLSKLSKAIQKKNSTPSFSILCC